MYRSPVSDSMFSKVFDIVENAQAGKMVFL